MCQPTSMCEVKKEETGCTTCGEPVRGGQKYEGVCLRCMPEFRQWCSGCERRLWACQCVHPHTWE